MSREIDIEETNLEMRQDILTVSAEIIDLTGKVEMAGTIPKPGGTYCFIFFINRSQVGSHR